MIEKNEDEIEEETQMNVPFDDAGEVEDNEEDVNEDTEEME